MNCGAGTLELSPAYNCPEEPIIKPTAFILICILAMTTCTSCGKQWDQWMRRWRKLPTTPSVTTQPASQDPALQESPRSQPSVPAPEPNVPAPAATTAPATVSPMEEDVDLGRILLDRQPIPVTTPVGGISQRRSPSPRKNAPMVVDRRCQFRRDRASGWVLATFEADESMPTEHPRWVLPNSWLEAVEAIIADDPKARFTVSFEPLLFERQGYMLLREAARLSHLPPDPGGATTAPAPQTAPATQPQPTTDQSGPDDQAISTDDLKHEMLKVKKGKMIVVLARPKVSASAEEAPVFPPSGRGTYSVPRARMVVDRLARIVPTGRGRWKMARFESDNTLAEPPIRLLPCELLEEANSLAGGGNSYIVVRISGEITVYRGRRYLLLRKLLKEREMDVF